MDTGNFDFDGSQLVTSDSKDKLGTEAAFIFDEQLKRILILLGL